MGGAASRAPDSTFSDPSADSVMANTQAVTSTSEIGASIRMLCPLFYGRAAVPPTRSRNP